MPIVYQVKNIFFSSAQAVKLKQWLIAPGEDVQEKSELFLGDVDEKVYVGLSLGEGIFSTQLKNEGQSIEHGQSICTIAADGEDIPYGENSSYCTFKEYFG
jgi:hypothetical protein